jgi:hypothetical protein
VILAPERKLMGHPVRSDTDHITEVIELAPASPHRAVDDLGQLARAARIVRAALARRALEPADLIEEGGPDAA